MDITRFTYFIEINNLDAMSTEKWSTVIVQKWSTYSKEILNIFDYLSPILDMCTNEIISYDLSLSPNLIQITNMLDNAFEKFPKLNNLILHSDQGWQYQHKLYVSKLKEHKIKQSMSREGNCYDNSIMETFFAR